jgi:SAM-dependent methyltransferase
MTKSSEFEKSYASFGLKQSYHQIKSALGKRSILDKKNARMLEVVREAEKRMEDVYGGPIEDLDILEVGPGQGMTRAYYFGLKNRITALDTDIIARGFDIPTYWKMFRTNGAGRVIKSFGRELIVGRQARAVWAATLDTKKLTTPENLCGDICQEVPGENAFDVVMSWSVFEHVPDPDAAMDNILKALRPGGIFYISLHLYTSNYGHHDIRAFTGSLKDLPLWGHLRPSTEHLITPSSYLNEWRLSQYRETFSKKSPGYVEILEKFEHPEVYGPYLTGDLREELADYDDDELLTVNAVYIGKKPE